MSISSGARVGPYEILSPLGAGGMGEVYRARDTKLNRDVALKVLPETLARDPERMARFKREAQVLASLNHPNIATIYGFEESDGVRALAMELVEGQTLAERIDAGRGVLRAPAGGQSPPLPIDDALPVAKQIADALEFAHERGIIHRDLKPANVKVTPEGAVKVLDFGLAKALDVDPSSSSSNVSNSPTLTVAATQAGVIIGTAAYMSPEQARGKAADRRADIWSFGCVLYEMLSGKRLFEGETVSDTLAAVLKTEPDWDVLPADTPPRVRELNRRCLVKDPRQRLQAIGDARITIEEVISGDVGASRGLAQGEATPRPHQTSWHALPWTLAGVLAVALIAVVFLWKFSSPARQSSMRFTAITNFAGVQAQPAISPDGRSVAFVSNRDGHYNIYVGLVGGGSLVQITHNPDLKEWPRWSPDGTKLAYSQLTDSGTVDVWEVPALGGTPRRLILDARDPDWSPDGRSIAYENMADRAIWMVDSSGQNPRQVIPVTGRYYSNTGPRFSPDGRELAFVVRFAGPYGELAVEDVTSGKVRLLTQDNVLVASPSWSPSGKSIYFASSRGGTMNIWKIPKTGGSPEQITTGQGDDAQLDVSADGKSIVFSTFRENMNIFQVDLEARTGAQDLKPLTTDPARNQIAPAYSPDGRRLAYFSNRKGAEREGIWISNADGSNPVQVVQDNRVNIFPHWSPDGEHLVYFSQIDSHSNRIGQTFSNVDFRLVPVSGGAPQTILENQRDNLFDLGPHGRLLFSGEKGKVQSYNPSDKNLQTLTPHPPGKNFDLLRWSPDGNSISYIVKADRENDPNAGLWVDDLKNPPRQVFRGWVLYSARGPHDQIYLLEGKADMTGVMWKVGWDGKGLTRLSSTVPMIFSFWTQMPKFPQEYFDVSPDGLHLALGAQGILQANIGMLENVR